MDPATLKAYETRAADFATEAGAYAVKRYRAHPASWVFASENPAYEPVTIPKSDMPYPILGVFVGKVVE